MPNLYDINAQMLALIDEETGEIADFEAFAALQLEHEQKRENLALWIKNLESDAAAYKAEKQAFAERQAAAENKAARLKEYLARDLCGEKFTTARVACSFRKSDSVNITDISRLPEQFVKRAEPTADKAAIKIVLKSGGTVEGAELVTKKNLVIK